MQQNHTIKSTEKSPALSFCGRFKQNYSEKDLLKAHNHEQQQLFRKRKKLQDNSGQESITIIPTSILPGITYAGKTQSYTKETQNLNNGEQISFVSRQEAPFSRYSIWAYGFYVSAIIGTGAGLASYYLLWNALLQQLTNSALLSALGPIGCAALIAITTATLTLILIKPVFNPPDSNQKDSNSKPIALLWHTNAKSFQKAVRWSIIPVASPAALSVQQLGTYRLKVQKRIVDEGVKSTKHAVKSELLNLYQDRLEALYPIERCINLPLNQENFSIVRKRLLDAIDKYQKGLQAIQQNRPKGAESKITKYDNTADTVITESLNQDQKRAQALQKEIENISTPEALLPYVRATGTKSLLTWVRVQAIGHIKELQCINQDISYSGEEHSLTRGDLNTACVDAAHVLRNYQVDQHNPITCRHQGVLEEDPTPNEHYTHDFSEYNANAHKQEEALMAVLAITEEDNFDPDDEKIRCIRATKWGLLASPTASLQRAAIWLWNTLSGVIVGIIIDFPVGLLCGLMLIQPKPSTEFIKITPAPPTGRPKSRYQNLKGKLHISKQSLGTQVGLKLANFVQNFFIDIIWGIRSSLKELTLGLFENLQLDWLQGKQHSSENTEEDILTILQKLEERLNNHKSTIKQRAQAKTSSALQLKAEDRVGDYTRPLYRLGPGKWKDLPNEIVGGAKAFVEFFVHHVHERNPFAGLLFNAFYVAGGLAILSPKIVGFLGQHYIACSKDLAATMSNGKLSSAIASAFTQAKIAAAVWETGTHGSESWIISILKDLEEDPANSLIYTSLAIGMGALIAHKVIYIPLLSEHLNNEIGSFPPAALGFAGLKVIVLFYGLLEAPKAESITGVRIQKPEKATQELLQTLISTEKIEELLRKLTSTEEIIAKLQSNKDYLYTLTPKEKDQLLAYFRSKKDSKEATKSLEACLMPEPSHSIFATNIIIVLGYIPLLLRCIVSILCFIFSLGTVRITRPWQKLFDKIVKDVTRIAHAVNTGIRVIANFIDCMLRSTLDVFICEIGARMECYFGKELAYTLYLCCSFTSISAFVLHATIEKGIELSMLNILLGTAVLTFFSLTIIAAVNEGGVKKFSRQMALSSSTTFEKLRQKFGVLADTMRYEATSLDIEAVTTAHLMPKLDKASFKRSASHANNLNGNTSNTETVEIESI